MINRNQKKLACQQGMFHNEDAAFDKHKAEFEHQNGLCERDVVALLLIGATQVRTRLIDNNIG